MGDEVPVKVLKGRFDLGCGDGVNATQRDAKFVDGFYGALVPDVSSVEKLRRSLVMR